MQAGIAKVEITPDPPDRAFLTGFGNSHDKPTTGVHDPLYARILWLDDGHRRVALVALDLIGLNPAPYAAIARDLGLDGLLLSASHTHAGPMILDLCVPYAEDRSWPVGAPYLNQLEARIANGLAQARDNLQSVRFSAGQGWADLCFNRRKVGHDGRVEMIWHTNRQRRWRYEPTDPEVGVVRLDDEAGQPLALLCHYACHPVIVGAQNRLLSADFPGYTSAYLEKAFPGAVALFLQGGAGDLQPYVDNVDEFEPAVEQGEALGREAERVARSLSAADTLDTSSIEFCEFERTFRRFFDADQWCTVRFSALRLGPDLAFVNLPGEPFVDLQLDLKKRSPAAFTYLLGYTNGYAGYFPTRKASREGGYGAGEGFTLHVEAGAGETMIDDALKVLDRPHLAHLEPGIEAWNQWRQAHPECRPNLCGIQRRFARLQGIDLTHTDLRHADLQGANFIHADLRGADLRGAKLIWAKMTGVSLAVADLRDADLTGVELQGADLSDADLSHARLRNAFLQGADLSKTKGLKEEQLREAQTDGETRLPFLPTMQGS